MLKKKDDVKRLYSPYCTSYSKPRPKHTSLSKANLAAVLQLKALNSFFSYVCDPLHKKKKKNLLLFFYKNVQRAYTSKEEENALPFALCLPGPINVFYGRTFCGIQDAGREQFREGAAGDGDGEWL